MEKGGWWIKSEGRVRSFDARRHIDWILDRLIAGNIVLVVGFIVALTSAIGLVVKEKRSRRVMAILALVLVAANPLQQPIFLEPLDSYVNYRWRDRSEQLKIAGKTPDEIRNLFGSPSYVWTETPKTLDSAGKVTWQGETYTGWDYHVMPFYWIGSKFQIIFVDGKVKNIEANDD